jgi:hypothetical protein
MSKNLEKVSVSLGQPEQKIVGHLSDSKGLNFSAALRMIIHEWHDLQGTNQRTHITESGRQTLENEK